jgi:RHS repeat-associated protein
VVTDPPQRNLFANGYRWYNPDWGRYTQSDPMGLVDDNVEPYAYASSNPLLYTDPDGLLVIPAGSGCRALKPKRLARWLSRLANNDECSSYFCDMFGTDLGTLLSPNSPPFLVLREGHGGGYRWSRDHYDPSPIYVGRAHCNNASDFFHVVVHELGHFADYQRGDWMQNEEDGCGAEVACFGNTIGANCMALGYPP